MGSLFLDWGLVLLEVVIVLGVFIDIENNKFFRLVTTATYTNVKLLK